MVDKIQYAGADASVLAMTKQEFFALAEGRRRKGAGSGFTEWGQQPSAPSGGLVFEGLHCTTGTPNVISMGRDFTDAVGVSRTITAQAVLEGIQSNLFGVSSPNGQSNIYFPDAPDGTKTYDSATGAVVQHVDSATAFAAETATNKVITSRQDYMFLEVWHEEIEDKDVVYPLGNVQYGASSYEGITLNNSLVAQGYSAFGEWDTTTQGYGVTWSTLSDADKAKFLQDPENNIYSDGDKLIQVRYRIRVVEGLGDDWANVNQTLDGSTSEGRLCYQLVNPVAVQGQLLSPDSARSLFDVPKENIGAFRRQGDATASYSEETFALPIALVQRRNFGMYHPTYNPQGTGWGISDSGASGGAWYTVNAHAGADLPVASTVECFDYYDASTNTSGRASSKTQVVIGGSQIGRPDSKPVDVIYASDVQDLRMSNRRRPLAEIREEVKRKAIAGEVRGFEGVPFTKVFSSVGAVETGYTIVNQDNPSAVVAQRPQLHSQANPTWTDIIGDPARILVTFPDGVEGQWIPSVPDGTAVEFKFSRKVQTILTHIFDSDVDAGINWTDGGAFPIDTVANSRTFSAQATQVALYHYETQAHFTEDDVNSMVLDLGGVFSSLDYRIERGSALASTLIGKVNTDLTIANSLIDVDNGTVQRLFTGELRNVSHGALPITSPANDSPAVKTLDYLSVEDGVAKLNYAYKEMVYDVTWGDNDEFEIVDNQATLTDDNGNTVKYGTASFKTQYFIDESN